MMFCNKSYPGDAAVFWYAWFVIHFSHAFNSCAVAHCSSQGKSLADPLLLFLLSFFKSKQTKHLVLLLNLLILISQLDTAGQILPSCMLHLIKTGVCVYINAYKAGKSKALWGFDTISDSDQFKRQWIHSVQKWLIPLWLIPERKIWLFVSMFEFSLKIRPVTQMLILQTCLFGKWSLGSQQNKTISAFSRFPLGHECSKMGLLQNTLTLWTGSSSLCANEKYFSK